MSVRTLEGDVGRLLGKSHTQKIIGGDQNSPYAALQPDQAAMDAEMARRVKATKGGHIGDIIGRAYEYE